MVMTDIVPNLSYLWSSGDKIHNPAYNIIKRIVDHWTQMLSSLEQALKALY